MTPIDYNGSRIDICLVEEDPAQRALLRARLLRDHYSVMQVDNGRDALALIHAQRPRVVICDLSASPVGAIELCQQIRADGALDGIYVILLTAYDSRERKYEALSAGADDYLMKPYDLMELSARIRNGLRICRLQERLQSAARTDGLTGLWNHAQFRSHLDNEFSRTRRYGGSVSLLMIDLDHFKAVNDTFGHEAGNRILAITARHLKLMVRDIDIVARYGGEEFSIILPETGPDAARQLAERIRATLPAAATLPECPDMSVTCSIGCVCNTDPRVGSALDMINFADQALYAAKRAGRNRVVAADDRTCEVAGDELRVGDIDQLRKQVVSLSMQAKTMCLQSIWSLVQALETRDPFTARHSLRMRFCIERLAQAAQWPPILIETASNAAMLHDLGKIGVPDHILLKNAPLTEDEAVVVRQVPMITCKILSPMRVFENEIVVIRHLRERFDGTGYPDGLVGTRIPLCSRALSIIEAFIAMTSGRSYRANRTIRESMAEIQTASGTQFDPALVELLARTIEGEISMWETNLCGAQNVFVEGAV